MLRRSFFVLVIVLLVWSGVVLSGPQMGGTFVIAYEGNPISFNPDWKIDDMGAGIYPNIFSKLVTLDVNYNVIPDLAKSWEVSSDGKVYTFHLRKGVKWHDGVPFTSADVKWTFDKIISAKGCAYNNLEKVKEITCPDDYTVVIKLKEPYAPFLGFIAWYGTYIMPKHLYAGTDWGTNPHNQNPVGTGPFKFVEWVKGDHVTLKRNDDYWAGKPYLDKVVYKIIPDSNTAMQAFLNGEADYDENRPGLPLIPVLQKTPGVRVIVTPSPSRYYISFNLRKGRKTSDLLVRQAIELAIDRNEIVKKVLKNFGKAAVGFYTPAIPWACAPDVKLPAMDVEKANALLDKAGYKRDAKGVRFNLDLLYFQESDWADMAAVIKENLAKVGIKVNLGEYEIATWIDKVLKAHDFDLALLDGFQGPDPDNLRLRVGTHGSIQFMGYSNPEVDEALDKGSQIADIEKRKPYYYKVERLLAKDLPILPLAEVVYVRIFKNYVHGLPIEEPGKVGTGNYYLVWLSK